MTAPRRLLFSLAAMACATAPGRAADLPIPDDLDLIPRDAHLVASARVAKLWAGDLFKGSRDMIGGNDDDAAMFGYRPSDLDWVTVAVTPDGEFGVITTVEPTDRKAARRLLAARGVELRAGKVTCYRSEEHWVTGAFAGDRATTFGPSHAFEALCRDGHTKPSSYPDALRLAATHAVVVVAHGEGGVGLVLNSLSDPLRKAAPRLKASLAVLTLDRVAGGKGRESKLVGRLTVRCGSGADAKTGAGAVAGLLDAGRAELGRLRDVWEKDGPPFTGKLNPGLLAAIGKAHGVEVGKFTFSADGRGFVVDLTISEVKDVGTLALMAVFNACMTHLVSDGGAPKPDANLERLAKAVLAYEKDHGRLLPPAVYARDGKTPLLSWRVMVLPYLGGEAKKPHAEFKLGEP